MGRKSRTKFFSESESEESEEEEELQKPLWSVIIQDAEDKIGELLVESEDDQFKWLGVSEIKEFINNVLHNHPDYTNFSSRITCSNYIGIVSYIIDILDLENIPLIIENEEHYKDKDENAIVVHPITNPGKVVCYLCYKIDNHFEKYKV